LFSPYALCLTVKYAMPRIGVFERVSKGIAYFMLGASANFLSVHILSRS